MTKTEPIDDVAQRKARALELERLRRAAQRSAKHAEPADLAAVEVAWKRLGVAPDTLREVLVALRELSDAVRQVARNAADTPFPVAAISALAAALDGNPTEQLRSAVRDLLLVSSGIDGAATVCSLQSAGLEVVPADAFLALKALTHDGLASVEFDTLAMDFGPHWRRFADMALIALRRSPKDPTSYFRDAPLPLLDAYIDRLADPPPPKLWASRSAEDQRYLTARTHPVLLEDEDVAALGWWDEYHRRRLTRGLPYEVPGEGSDSELYDLLDQAVYGNISLLGRLAELLPTENAAVIRQLSDGAKSDEWPADFYEDYGLWLLMARLWVAGKAMDPKRSQFHRWAAFQRAYDLTVDGRFDAAWEQILAFGKLPVDTTPAEREVLNLAAYLVMIRSNDKALEEAIGLLQTVSNSLVAADNLKWLRKRKDSKVNDREPPENPYLYLGVDHGAPTDEWMDAWRAIRSEHKGDVKILSAANQAKDRIRDLERDGSNGQGQVFVVPLAKKYIMPPEAKLSARLIPRAKPLLQRTSQEGLDTAMEELRSAALRELLGTAVTTNGITD